jgi:hypothetical protein
MNLTAEIVMQLIDGYAENRHKLGAPEYNDKTALSRECVKAAIETIIRAAVPPSLLFDVKKGLQSAAGQLGPMTHGSEPSASSRIAGQEKKE